MAQSSSYRSNLNSILDIQNALHKFNTLHESQIDKYVFKDILHGLHLIMQTFECKSPKVELLVEWFQAYLNLQNRLNPNDYPLYRKYEKSIPSAVVYAISCASFKVFRLPHFHYRILKKVYTLLTTIMPSIVQKLINQQPNVIFYLWHIMKFVGDYNTQLLCLRLMKLLLQFLCENQFMQLMENIEIAGNAELSGIMQSQSYQLPIFDNLCRQFINNYNFHSKEPNLVYSFCCEFIEIGENIRFYKTFAADQFWIDLNYRSFTLTFEGRFMARNQESSENKQIRLNICELKFKEQFIEVICEPQLELWDNTNNNHTASLNIVKIFVTEDEYSMLMEDRAILFKLNKKTELNRQPCLPIGNINPPNNALEEHDFKKPNALVETTKNSINVMNNLNENNINECNKNVEQKQHLTKTELVFGFKPKLLREMSYQSSSEKNHLIKTLQYPTNPVRWESTPTKTQTKPQELLATTTKKSPRIRRKRNLSISTTIMLDELNNSSSNENNDNDTEWIPLKKRKRKTKQKPVPAQTVKCTTETTTNNKRIQKVVPLAIEKTMYSKDSCCNNANEVETEIDKLSSDLQNIMRNTDNGSTSHNEHSVNKNLAISNAKIDDSDNNVINNNNNNNNAKCTFVVNKTINLTDAKSDNDQYLSADEMPIAQPKIIVKTVYDDLETSDAEVEQSYRFFKTRRPIETSTQIQKPNRRRKRSASNVNSAENVKENICTISTDDSDAPSTSFAAAKKLSLRKHKLKTNVDNAMNDLFDTLLDVTTKKQHRL